MSEKRVKSQVINKRKFMLTQKMIRNMICCYNATIVGQPLDPKVKQQKEDLRDSKLRKMKEK